jgi:hypothetical protein
MEFETNNLFQKPEFIHTVIVIIIYKFIQLYNKKIRLINWDLNYVYVCDNNLELNDYYFTNELIVSILKAENTSCSKIKVFHYGNDFCFPFTDYTIDTYSETELIHDIKTFINQLYEKIPDQ